MELFYHRSGQGSPLVILHGLFGTWENLGATVKSLSEHWDVIAPDLRNHGRSPHAEDCSYAAMAEDVLELLNRLNIEHFSILGHSMGGKVAMELALTQPTRTDNLIVVDIAPVQYPHHHDKIFKGLRNVQLSQINSRSEADKALQSEIDELSIRSFLLKNLVRSEDAGFSWRMNLDALEKNYSQIAQAISVGQYTGPTLFIKGALSNYLIAEYQDEVVKRFPKAQVRVIDQAGHWPHAEKPQIFIKLVERFLGA